MVECTQQICDFFGRLTVMPAHQFSTMILIYKQHTLDDPLDFPPILLLMRSIIVKYWYV